MTHLLDVNVLVAWGWADHAEHKRVARWIRSIREAGSGIATSAIPELGFVRVSVQRSRGTLSIEDAAAALQGLLQSVNLGHTFLPDDCSATEFPLWCVSPAQTTDAHLLDLATKHGARLATLDRSIPGAFVIPELVA